MHDYALQWKLWNTMWYKLINIIVCFLIIQKETRVIDDDIQVCDGTSWWAHVTYKVKHKTIHMKFKISF